jgi:hypothetical protein
MARVHHLWKNQPAQRLGLQHARKTLHVERFVARPRVKAFAVTVLPARSRLHKKGFGSVLRDPALPCIRDEFRSVVRTNEVRHTELFDKRVEDFGDVAAVH